MTWSAEKFYLDDRWRRIWNWSVDEYVDEDENEEEMNKSIIHHKQTLIRNKTFIGLKMILLPLQVENIN